MLILVPMLKCKHLVPVLSSHRLKKHHIAVNYDELTHASTKEINTAKANASEVLWIKKCNHWLKGKHISTSGQKTGIPLCILALKPKII